MRAPIQSLLATHLICTSMIAGLFFSPSAKAETLCLDNGTELAVALRRTGSNGEDDVIRVTTGRMRSNEFSSSSTWTYRFSTGDSDKLLELSGGWNSGCTTQTRDPSLTVLDAQNYNTALYVGALGAFDYLGRISVSNLTISNGKSEPIENGDFLAAGLHLTLLGTSGAQVNLDNLIFTEHRQEAGCTGCSVASIKLSTAGILRFRNNVVHSNGITNDLRANVKLATNFAAIAYVSNNSVFNNRVSAQQVGLELSGTMVLSNNVIAQNTSSTSTTIFQLTAYDASGLSLYNNHITSSQYQISPPFIEQGTSQGDPMWSGSGPYRVPSTGSPLLNTGRNNASGGLLSTDIRGQPRLINGTVDRGAVEQQPATNTGPTISALVPNAGSTTTLQPTSDPFQLTKLFFLTQSGTGTAFTSLDCATQGSGVVTQNPQQIVGNGGLPLPVELALPAPTPGEGDLQTTVQCQVFRENANNYVLTYQFVVKDSQLFRNGFE